MNRALWLVGAVCLASVFTGCDTATNATQTETPPEGMTLVRLKVPNMV